MPNESFALYSHKVIFDSRSSLYKQPFGAVLTGQPVRIRVCIPRHLGVLRMTMLVKHDMGELSTQNMEFIHMQGSGDIYECTLTLSGSGVYFYYFAGAYPGGTYYFRRKTDSSQAEENRNSTHTWQLTVYEKEFTTPKHLKGGIIYQIFPDRFCCSGKPKKGVREDRIIHTDLTDKPNHRKASDGEFYCNDYFGGDFQGIMDKLNYLKDLGVTLIYLNPIFEAHSNHRYNTADFMNPDPMLGTDKEFSKLCKEAEKRGIGIIIDCAFSHVGSDSVYFNRFGRYDSIGAYQSKESPYFGWFRFSEWPDKYESWWGFDTLPEVDEENESYKEFICGKNGVIRRWMKLGCKGIRLDVADELPDSFIKSVRETIKSCDPEAFLIGEVWEDASNKISYDRRRAYLTGHELDSVMNYPFKNAIIDFVKMGNAKLFAYRIMTIIENYPKPIIDVLMNCLSTHDTVRLITDLVGEPPNGRDREWQAAHPLSQWQRERGEKLAALCFFLGFTMPGLATVYYGDEVLMEGYLDPFNRGYFEWNRISSPFTDLVRRLALVRRSRKEFAEGLFELVYTENNVVAFTRCTEDGASGVLCVINRGEETASLPFGAGEALISYGNSRSEPGRVLIGGMSFAVFLI